MPGTAPAGRVMVVPLAVASVVLGAVAARMASGDTPVLGLLFPLLLLPWVLWKYPQVGLYLVFLGVITIEQFAYLVGPRDGAATAKIPFFQGALPGGVNLAEVLLAFVLLIVVMQFVKRREPLLHRSVIAGLLAAVVGLIAVYLVVGLSRGGDLKMALWEVRPFVYLAFAYLLATALIDRTGSVRPLLWILVIGGGAKALYGLTIWYSVRELDPRPEAVLAHEESFLFGLFIFATAAMWLFGVRGRLRWVATAVLPIVLVADMVNSRRTAWLILFLGMGLLMVVALVSVPERRKMIGVLMTVGAICAVVYLPAFWSQDGTLAQPARAVRSEFSPDERDKASNQYREIEDYNVMQYINQSRSMGMGFGQRLTYYGLVDLTKDAPMLAFVPHNGVLYLWLRMGLAGVTLFAVLVTQAMITAVRLSRAPDRETGMMGAIVAAALVGYVAMGVTDMGFFWFRNALAMGLLLGIADGLARRERHRLEAGATFGADAGSVCAGAADTGFLSGRRS